MSSEPNGNARVGNIIAGAALGLAVFGGWAASFIIPLQDKIASVKEELKEFKSAYMKYHDDLDNRLQREMRDINDKTEQKVLSLNDKIEKEIELNMKIVNDKFKHD